MFNQALDYWSLDRFMVLDEILQELRAVTVDQFNKTRQLVLSKLDGAYMMMGTVRDFHPEFPEVTWEGKFE